MEEQKATLKTTELAKEKGFPWEIIIYHSTSENGTVKYYNVLPTQSLLHKWLRKKHRVYIAIQFLELSKVWGYEIYNIKTGEVITFLSGDLYTTYEQALEEGLQKVLKLI